MGYYLVAAIVGYAFGCIQTSYLLGRFVLKQDIRELGNRNAGASNATVVFGKKIGFLTGIVDILKAVISIAVIRLIFGGGEGAMEFPCLLYFNGLFVILGHNFPFYMGFKGGKGTASLVGMLLGLDLWLGLIGIAVLVIATLITDFIAMGTMALLGVLLIHTLLFHPDPIIMLSVIVIVIMSVYKHWPNIIKIKNGEEKSVRKTLMKKD